MRRMWAGRGRDRFVFFRFLSCLYLEIHPLVRYTAYEGKVITTKSNPAAFPSSLRQLKTSLVKNTGDVDKKKVYVRRLSSPPFLEA